MARILIAGCGCRGRELAAALVAEGRLVRGTTRDEARLESIRATGAEAVLADPDRLSTLLPQLPGVTTLCWLMGTAVGDPEVIAAIHGQRLEALLGKLVETPVRGFVYEAAGRAERRWLEHGAAAVRGAGRTHRLPVEIVYEDPGDLAAWIAAVRAAVARTLGPRG